MAVAMDVARVSSGAVGDGADNAVGHGGADVLAGLRRELDASRRSSRPRGGGGETLVALLALGSRVEALVCRQLAVFGREDEWRSTGVRTAAAWIAVESRGDPTQVQARVRGGRALWRTDRVADAFAAGTIAVEHVDRLSRACTRWTVAAFERDESMLVNWAETMQFADFAIAVDMWMYRADEDRAERRATKQHRRRRFHLSQSFEDTWYANGVLDPVSGQIVHGVLSRIERELFEADWADARIRPGRDPHALARSARVRDCAARDGVIGRGPCCWTVGTCSVVLPLMPRRVHFGRRPRTRSNRPCVHSDRLLCDRRRVPG